MKIGIASLGCPKNLVDSEIMLGILKDKNYLIVNNQHEADIIIINTCGFIESARKESIDTILEMAECKKGSCRLLIVAGCLAQRYKHEILEEIPEVDAVIGTGSYSEITNIIDKALSGSKPETYGDLCSTSYTDSDRIVSTGKGYAYLKIAEGCDNCCTYCIIPTLRGCYRSRRIEDIIFEASKLESKGIKELIVIAQDTTRYGIDIYGEKKLSVLLKKLSELNGIQRIRLLYSYPDEIDDMLINEIANNKKICKYLDIPIQHACDKILKSMGRRGDSLYLGNLLDKIKQRIPEIILRTSLIVGFPGETEEDFGLLCGFVEKYRFDRLGVFMYSREEDTIAAVMKQQVPKKIKQKRYNIIMKIQKQISAQKNNLRLGKDYSVLVEGLSEDGVLYFGRSYAEAPDIDGLIYFTSKLPLETSMLVNVKILKAEQYDLIGEAEYEST